MAVLYDARGNPINAGFPDGVTNETITDARPITAALSALNAENVIDLNGVQTVQVDIRTAAANLTAVFEGTIDGVNYIGLPGFALANAAAAPQGPETFLASVIITATYAAVFTVPVAGFRRFRIRVSAFTSGSITTGVRASSAQLVSYSKPIPAPIGVTVTAAANLGATLTLPAPGAGLFHYITGLYVARTATAALAGTATLVITSTNLSGAMAWSVGNAMAAGGTQRDLEIEPANPIKSLVANTATTVVMPVPGAAVLWRAWAFYYVGA